MIFDEAKSILSISLDWLCLLEMVVINTVSHIWLFNEIQALMIGILGKSRSSHLLLDNRWQYPQSIRGLVPRRILIQLKSELTS
jgi:hypothetical protein